MPDHRSSNVGTGIALLAGAVPVVTAVLLAEAGRHAALAWLPAGVASAILLRLGHARWPFLAAGALLGALLAGQTFPLAVGTVLVAVGGPALLSSYLQSAPFERSLSRWHDVIRLLLAAAVTTALTAALATMLPEFIAPASVGMHAVRKWFQLWLTAYLGTLLVVPMLLDVSAQVLSAIRTRWLELCLVLLGAAFLVVASFNAPSPLHGFVVGPPALILVGYAALRFHISVAAALAGLLTCAIGLSPQPAPVSEFVSGLFGQARAWAFGVVNALLIFTVQVLRSERLAALDALREAERRHRTALLHAARLEQLKIGQQMHDEVGQEATALSLLARSIERRLEQGTPVQPSEAKAIVESAKRIHVAMRNAVQRLLAVDHHNGSLTEALRALVDRLQRAGAPSIDLQLPATLDHVPPYVAEVLFRTAQEALNNAIKHAHAGRLGVSITWFPGHIELRVSDDGIGLPPLPKPGGFGLQTMRHRAEQVGGRLDSRVGAGSGTEIILELPVLPPGLQP
jgi:two-component system sensor histidine kinase UhpB